MRDIDQRELTYVLSEVQHATGSLYGLYADDPVGFVEDILGETLWSRQREVLAAIPTTKRLIVPAGFGVGKTFLAGRAAAWWCATNPVGAALCVTTATRFRQVRNQLWPHIRKAVARGGLPGQADTTQWKIPDAHGVDTLVAYGFTAPENDEAAMQGIHSNRLLLIVDEAGGIGRTIGEGTNNLLTGEARMLAIGNPATNDPGGWFERMTLEGESEKEPTTSTIRIATLESPRITGERTPPCRDCVPNTDGHTVAGHMPDQDWVDRTVTSYGGWGHPYVVAKVLAQFPRDGGGKVIPYSWIEAAAEVEDPTGDGYVRLCDLGLSGETARHAVAKGSWVRLGVDVAADGGDEFTIYRAVGDAVEYRHASAGAQNASQVTVAERVLEEIGAAQRLADALGSKTPVRVKVDKNGLGHGATSMLERWRKTGRHHADIVGVMVSESPHPDRVKDEGQAFRPNRKRDEMWTGPRELMEPDPSTGYGRLRLRVDRECLVQLSNPDMGWTAGGFVVVESKKSMKKRGVSSPDRAEGALLAVYEPEPIVHGKRRGLLVG